jgi:hypothetical protein
MRQLLAAAALALVLLAPGCCPEKAAMPGVEACWKVIEPEYVGYLNADPRFKDPDPARQAQLDALRADRLKTAEALSKVIAEARKVR